MCMTKKKLHIFCYIWLSEMSLSYHKNMDEAEENALFKL